MHYNINKTNYRDFNKISENLLEHRSYFIPFSTEKAMLNTDYLSERQKSDAVLLLSGEWDFIYYDSASRLKEKLDTDKVGFDKIHVPSTWQKTGYDKINYLNSMYPFRCNPPKTPKNCPVGVYRKNFSLKKKQGNTYYITFLGACASLDLYVNGSYIGYGEGSHNTREFDISEFLNDGKNELIAVVFKWSTGTYLECQDMFRENGIFRDVYITEQPESFIFDYLFLPQKNGDNYDVTITNKILGKKGGVLSAELKLNGDCIASKTVNAGEKLKFENLDVIEWNAEAPTCYDLILKLKDDEKLIQCVRSKVGFRTIALDGYKYLFNGKLIKLKGVNHHDSHPIRGYAMTADDLKKDVELMKAFNVNCVRTSHYPPDPLLITLCDIYGIYVIDEADIETHGCFMKNIDLISNDPKWKNHYLDRMAALYERDKNHSCVVMWSMGNEAGGISNFDACYEYLKGKSNIPVHYEPACRSDRVRYDILAHFYTPPAEMRALARGEWKGEKNYDAPFFLCEYAHSMGVGPGALDEYWDVIYSDERFLGGCIWEWADHSHYDENAKYKYTYGGDHKDRLNSGNFCCDGLFYPDRTPSVSALCMKNVYSPLKASLTDSSVEIKNTNLFISSENIKILYYLLTDGKSQEEKEFDTIIEPWQSKFLPLPEYDKDKDAFLVLKYIDKATNKIIAKEQIVLNEALPGAEIKRQQINWIKNGENLSVNKGSSKFAWDSTGRLACIIGKNGSQITANKTPCFEPILYQAVIDNHVYAVKELKKAGIPKLKASKGKCAYDDYLNTVSSSFALCDGKKKRFNAEIIYKAVAQNKVRVTFSITSLYKKPLDMLTIGLILKLNGSCDKIKYYGMGDTESYSDFSAQDVMGIYETNAHDMYVQNIKPQESGNRNGVRWAEITDRAGSGIKITALEKPLNFKAVDIDGQNLQKAKHIEDIIRQDCTYLHINGFMRGIGSQSCGPDTDDKYKKILHLSETYSYSFDIEII